MSISNAISSDNSQENSGLEEDCSPLAMEEIQMDRSDARDKALDPAEQQGEGKESLEAARLKSQRKRKKLLSAVEKAKRKGGMPRRSCTCRSWK